MHMHTRHMSIWETAHKQCLEMGGLFKKLENVCYIQNEPIRFPHYNYSHLVTVQHFLSVLWQHLTHISLRPAVLHWYSTFVHSLRGICFSINEYMFLS